MKAKHQNIVYQMGTVVEAQPSSRAVVNLAGADQADHCAHPVLRVRTRHQCTVPGGRRCPSAIPR